MVQELIDGQWHPGTWQNYRQLTCAHCQWDTLDGIDAARAHAANCPRCAPVPEPEPPRLVFVADRFGNMVEQPGDPGVDTQEVDESGTTDID